MLNTIQKNTLNTARSVYRFKEKVLEQLTQKNYYTAKTYYFYKLRRQDNRFSEPPLLIHQMGKVGSSSVTRSLRMANIGRRVYQTHFLSPEFSDEYEQKRKGYLATDKEHHLKHIWQYQYLYKWIQQGLAGGQKWKVITLVRDPIARNISDFFTHIEIVSSEGNQHTLRSIEHGYQVSLHNGNLAPLIEAFFKKYNHHQHETYFDQELKKIFDVDVFASKFPTSKGYKIYYGEMADVLLIRLENLNECFTQTFKEFLNVDGLTLVNDNVGEKKTYADIYKKFRKIIYFPESYIERMYASAFSQHFYSQAELDHFRAKWIRPA